MFKRNDWLEREYIIKRVSILIVTILLCVMCCLTNVGASQHHEYTEVITTTEMDVAAESSQRVIPKIFIYVGSTLAYTYIDGQLEALFGFSLLDLSDQAFQAIVDAYNNIPNLYSVYLEGLNSNYVKKYITTTGQQCIKQRQGANYICTYGLNN